MAKSAYAVLIGVNGLLCLQLNGFIFANHVCTVQPIFCTEDLAKPVLARIKNCDISTLLENLTDGAIAKLYLTKFLSISLYLTKLYLT